VSFTKTSWIRLFNTALVVIVCESWYYVWDICHCLCLLA